MAKSSKALKQRRVQDVTKLILAGAEFADVAPIRRRARLESSATGNCGGTLKSPMRGWSGQRGGTASRSLGGT